MTIGILNWVEYVKFSLLKSFVWSELWSTSPRMMAILVWCHILVLQSFTSLGTQKSQSKCQILFRSTQVPIMQRVLKPYLKGGGAQAFKNANFQALTQDLLKATGESWMMWVGLTERLVERRKSDARWCNNSHIFEKISSLRWGKWWKFDSYMF